MRFTVGGEFNNAHSIVSHTWLRWVRKLIIPQTMTENGRYRGKGVINLEAYGCTVLYIFGYYSATANIHYI